VNDHYTVQDFIDNWEANDLFTALAGLPDKGDSVDATKGHHRLMRDLYWKDKNLPAVVAVACAGIAAASRAAAENVGEPIEAELLGLAKGMAYDLGSFTWPGWDEPGIQIGPTDMALGREAAKFNLRLAGELKRGDLPLSNAQWLIGAHDLAAGGWQKAQEAFAQAHGLSRSAVKPAAALLNTAYIRVAEALADPSDALKQRAVVEADQALAGEEGGDQLKGQALTALRVFLGTKPA
jgi:hypothetical protein